MDNEEFSNPLHEIAFMKRLERDARSSGDIVRANRLATLIKSLTPIDESTFVYAYEDIETAKYKIERGFKTEFTKPPQPVMWESRLIDCLIACKVMKTFCACFPEARQRYNFVYKNSFFYKSTSFYITYNSNNFTFEVTTGLKFRNNQNLIKNTNIDELYKSAEDRLAVLKHFIKLEIPAARYEEAMKRYDLIRKSRT